MDENKALKFLASHRLAVMSTVSADGKPHGAVMYYHIEPDFSLYFLTKTETSKYKNMLANPDVSVTIWDDEVSVTAQIEGSISEVLSTEMTDKVVRKLMNKGNSVNWPPPIAKMRAGDFVVMCVTPIHVQVGDFKKFHEDGYFTQLRTQQDSE